jgi:protein-disulfide isomerase/uncharacterized membrane protein
MIRTRIWLVLFSGVAFVASSAALYVHYNLITDSSYTSFCDISATVNCEAVYESTYGSVRGVPVAAGGVIWSALVLLLASRGMRKGRQAGSNVAEYVFVLSVIGLAAVLYLGYASYFILNTVCPLCVATYVGVFGVFFVSAGVTTVPFGSLPGRLMKDLRSLPASPAAVSLGLVWLLASAALLGFFPNVSPTGSAAASATPAAEASESGEEAPAEGSRALSSAQRADFERWLVAQPYVPMAVANDGAKVVIVKFNDYMCPPCRQTFLDYKSVLAKFAADFPGQVKFVTRHFPLEAECNTGGVHLASCEAAAAVLMARENGTADALEDWLFDNQPAMTPDLVRQGVRQVGGVTDFDARYPSVLALVKADVQAGQSLGVGQTPTFFINGRKVAGALEAEFFEAAIEYELARAQQGSNP